MNDQDTMQTPIPESGTTPWSARRRVLLAGAVAAALAIGGGGSAFAAAGTVSLATSALSSPLFSSSDQASSDGAASAETTDGSTGSATDGATDTAVPDGSSSGYDPGTSPLPPRQTLPGRGYSSGASPSLDATAATADQQIGVVTIDTVLNFDESSAGAGTGMVLTADGLVLTNHHVIEGSTGIDVTIESTGATYAATVLGSDATTDVAVLQLEDAAGLDAVQFDTSGSASLGTAVYSVGNALGTGELVTADGVITGLDETITVQGSAGSTGETLADLIEIDADVVSGDSGGPLFDADGEVIGMVTAASSGSADIVAYAVDIDGALTIAQQIARGIESGTVEIEYPAFLGVQITGTGADATGTVGAVVGGVFAGMPAAQAGLTAGPLVTAVDGVAVPDATALSAAIAAHEPGSSVLLTWLDAAGSSASATVTLGSGPAA